MRMGNNFTGRLILAVVSISLEEGALFVIWRWGLPQVDVYVPLQALIVVMVLWGAIAVTNFIIVTRVLRKATVVGLPTMVGSIGKVVKLTGLEGLEGLVRIRSELWSAESAEGDIDVGEEILVVAEEGLKLVVRRRGSSALKKEGGGE